MRTYTYHNEIKILLAQVLNALGDLVIRRLNEQNDTLYTDMIDVSLRYSPKQRVLHDLVNANQHIQLPTMCLSIAGISFQKERAFNKIMGFTVDQQYLSAGGRFPQPVPVDLRLNFSILTRYARDLEQILTCIFSQFFPYIVISYRHPDLEHEVRCLVEWDGNINVQYPLEINATQPYRIEADSSFVVKGWIYRNASNPWGIIHHVDASFTAVSAIYDDLDYLRNLENDDITSNYTTDRFTVSGRPSFDNVNPYFTNLGVTSIKFDILGDMFQFVEGVAVSGTNSVFPLSSYQLINPFVSSKNLSAVYGPFSGVPLLTSQWAYVNDTHMQLTLPETFNTGFVEVFAWGNAGLAKLTFDTIRQTQNPYVSGTAEYNNYVEYQWPCVSGIEIKN